MTKKNVLPIGFVHRNDFDGMCSGALLQKYFNNQIEIHPLDYGDKELRSDTAFLDAFDVKGRDVYICDFHLKPSLLKKVVDLSHLTTWLDHHKSAVDEIVASPWYKRGVKALLKGEEVKDFNKLVGLWYGGEGLPFSGAYLTWAWLFNHGDAGFVANETFGDNGDLIREYQLPPTAVSPDTFAPMNPLDQPNFAWNKTSQFIRNIAIADTHCIEFGYGPAIEIFQYGMKAIGLSFDTPDMWKALLSDLDNDGLASYDDIAKKNELTEQIEAMGMAVYQYNQRYEFPRINSAAFHIKLSVNGKNVKILALNVNGYNSEVFEPIYNPETEDAFLMYFYKNDHWSYSVYVPEDKKDKVSAVDIIRSFDETGGGHAGAAGGSSEKLLKELQR